MKKLKLTKGKTNQISSSLKSESRKTRHSKVASWQEQIHLGSASPE
jgi:hypothetical protein